MRPMALAVVLTLVATIAFTTSMVGEPGPKQTSITVASLDLGACTAASTSRSSTTHCASPTARQVFKARKGPAYAETRCPAVNGPLCPQRGGQYCCYFNEIDAWGCCLDVNHCCGTGCCKP